MPDDVNKVNSQENQNRISVIEIDDSTYGVEISEEPLLPLATFKSTNPNQTGEKDWIGLVVKTGLDDITKVKYNGNALTTQDVAEADSVKLDKGSFILWVPYSNLPKEFTLSYKNESKTITIEAM